MDHFQKLKRHINSLLIVSMLFSNILLITLVLGLHSYGIDILTAAPIALLGILVFSVVISLQLSTKVLEPLKNVWQGILHVTAKSNFEEAPNLDKVRMGRELVTSLLLQVYDLASNSNTNNDGERREKIIQSANIVSHMPLPLFVFNKDQLVTNASDAGLEYCQVQSSELFGKNLYESLQLEFPSDNTLEKWILQCQEQKVTDKTYWERVKVKLPDGTDKRCDMAAYYNRDNPSGTEFIVTMFDRTKPYQQDDENVSFVALAVHELRTPLTMLRGYIEVFNDELGGKLSDEMTDFMSKMDLAAKQLAAFVNNILNVARIDENSLTLHLAESEWPAMLEGIVNDMRLKAKVHQMEIKLEIGNDLPKVAVDRVSIYEVINNLVDNAIKYSGDSNQIIIHTGVGKDGTVETTVQDFGIGIPESVVPNLFEKFYRNHRTKSQIGGTGLGLFLSKSLVNAHGGHVWVSSKEGEGSTFGFSLIPYERLSEERKNAQNKEITRTAHGWIKNHSMYRR